MCSYRNILLSSLLACLMACQAAPSIRSPRRSAANNPTFGDSAEANPEISYPTFSYSGNGNISSSKGGGLLGGDSLNSGVSHNIATSMTATAFTLKNTAFQVFNSTFQSKMPAGSMPQVGQAAVFTLTSKGDVADASGNDTSFLMLATAATNFKGQALNFSKPVPIMIVPAPSSRYDNLRQQRSYTFDGIHVNSSAGSYDLKTIVSLVSEAGDTISIKIEYSIVNGSEELYQDFPLFRSATYVVDTKQKVITEIEAENSFYASSQKTNVTMTMNYSLCSRTQNGRVDKFSACP